MRNPSASQQVLMLARKHLLEFGECLPGMLDEPLAQSWQRSLSAGLQPASAAVVPEPLTRAELSQVIDHNQELLACARPVMGYFYEQLRQSHSMLVLADCQCTLIHTLGESSFLEKAERVALSPGASWLEESRGTNAIGLALSEQAPIRVQGAEHFLERNGFLHCAAAPIFSARGEVVGILDLSGDKRQDHVHSLGLVRTAARMIENRWLATGHAQHLRLHLHRQPHGLDTVAEAIVLVSQEGHIAGANREAMRLLALQPHDLGEKNLADLLAAPLEQWLQQAGRAPDADLRIQLADGSWLHAKVHNLQALRPRRVVALGGGAVARPFGRATGGDALSMLDTGDARWQAAAHKTRRVLDKRIPLLIQGESGSGKELFARAAHESGPRREQPFVAINCAAIPETLIEAELFGYAPGAFSGARREGNPGRLRQAHGGTLFLDEIGDMPLEMQARLLRVLQDGSVVPLGGGRAVEVDFALICATHRDLKQAVAQGRFRNDLYYRLNGLMVHLPPLRERQDFDALRQRILRQCHPHEAIAIAPAVLHAMRRYHWPGNLRQLGSMLQTACAMLESGELLIDWQHLADDAVQELQAAPCGVPPVVEQGLAVLAAPSRPIELPADAAPALPGHNLQNLSRQAIAAALQHVNGNISQAARALGISRQTLYRKLKRW